MIFKTSVDLFYKLIIVFIIVLFSFLLTINLLEKEFISFLVLLCVFIVVMLFLVGSIFTTKFILSENELICNSLFWKKSISYSIIQKVEQQEGFFVGWKMTTSFKGIIVHYNKYDEFCISPEKELLFTAEMKKRIENSSFKNN